jgi:nucleoid DNA-binding protein
MRYELEGETETSQNRRGQAPRKNKKVEIPKNHMASFDSCTGM